MSINNSILMWRGVNVSDLIVYVPKGSTEKYAQADVWSMIPAENFREVERVELNLNPEEITISVGEKVKVTANITKNSEDVTVESVKWESSNPEVATVNENGEVTGISVGYANINFTLRDNFGLSHSVVYRVKFETANILEDLMVDVTALCEILM